MDGSRLNLLQQEAMLADISDWILIFAESCGSFCELGAFSALPHAAWITSVAVGKQYKGSRSFLIDGPVEEIATGDSSLNKVFYLDLNNPMSSPDLCRFVSELRPLIGNMRKPLSIGMFVRARFETGLFRFPSGEPAHAAWLSRRLPGKLISAGSCGCASGGQPGMSAHPTAFRFSVRRYRTNPVFCRARPWGCPSKRS